VFKRFRDWVKADVFQRLFDAVSDEPDMEFAIHRPGMDGDPEPIQSTRRLALCHGRRTDQAQTPLSYIIRLMGY